MTTEVKVAKPVLQVKAKAVKRKVRSNVLRHSGDKSIHGFVRGVMFNDRKALTRHLDTSLAKLRADRDPHLDEKALNFVRESLEFSRSFLSDKVVLIRSGTRTRIDTSAAGVAIFQITSAGNISNTITTTTCPELAVYSGLFDELKICGVELDYQPYNPYNRGGTNISSMAFGWDDEAVLSPTNSLVGFGTLVNRAPLIKHFAPDHSFKHTFHRPSPMFQYDWTPMSAIGSTTATYGSLYIVGDGSSSVNAYVGTLNYQYLLMLRVRV